MLEVARLMLGAVASLLLIFLPGAWLTFGLPQKGLPFWARLLAGIMLAPLAISAQFYLFRLLSIPFDLSAVLCVAVNLPVIYLIYRQRVKLPVPDRNAILAAIIVAVVILASIAPFLINPQERLYTWEAWTQADVVYSVANGNLLLEDAELAGVRLAYPWVGHVYQAVLSFWAGTPPVTNYIWPNLIWLLCIFGFAAGIVAELGGNSLSRVTVAIWLAFGVNFVGYVLGNLVPLAWIKAHPILGGIWGDNRFTPWLDKILFFGQMYFAMGLFIAILYLMLKEWPDGSKRDYIIITGLMLCALALIYPVLLPPACLVVGLRGLLVLIEKRTRLGDSVGEILGLGLILLIALGVALAYTRFLTSDRPGTTLLGLNPFSFMRQRVIESIIVMSPLLAGLAVVLFRLWKEKRPALVLLVLGGVLSCSLYVFFSIPWYRNEYKFIFTAAICMAPFPALALEPLIQRAGRAALPLLAIFTGILAFPLASHVYLNAYTLYTETGPLVDTHNFDLRLADQEPLSGLLDAVRLKTPTDTLLVFDRANLHLPTLTRRQLYVPPAQAAPYPGVLVTSDETLTLAKGYSPLLLGERRSTLKDLFETQDNEKMSLALDKILELDRPLALILEQPRQGALVNWLSVQHIGRSIYNENGFDLWLIKPAPGVADH